MLCSVMGPEKSIIDKMGKLNLNLFFLTIGPSGLGRKTVPLKTYLIPILIKVTEKIDYPIILPNRFTVEMMIKYMNEDNMGTIIRDEFTSLFKEAQNKDYIADALEFISELYDGTIQPRATVKHGVSKMVNCFVCLIAATTPYLYKVMKPDFFTQGTGNRILIIIFDIENIKDEEINADEFFKGPVFETKRDAFIEEVADILATIRHCNFKYFIPTEEAGKVWTQFEMECRMRAKKRFKNSSYDLHYSYLGRLPEMTLKLAGIYAISRTWYLAKLKDCPSELIITASDMQRAVEKGRFHYEQFCRMMEQWRTRPEGARIQTFDEQALFVSEMISKNPGITWTALRKSTKWDTYIWKQVLQYLHQTESISIFIGESNGGRKPILFYEGYDTQAKGTQLKDWRFIEDILNLR